MRQRGVLCSINQQKCMYIKKMFLKKKKIIIDLHTRLNPSFNNNKFTCLKQHVAKKKKYLFNVTLSSIM